MRTFTVVPSFEGESAFFELPDIGFQGDHLSFAILFNLTELVEHWPNILPSMIVTDPQGNTFIAPHTHWDADAHIFTWSISSTETAYEGYVKCQLKCISADDPETIVCMSRICQTRVYQSLAAAENPPEAFQTWIDTLVQLGAQVNADVEDALASVEISETNARTAQAAADAAEIARAGAQQARNSVETTAQITVQAQEAATRAQQKAETAANTAVEAKDVAVAAQEAVTAGLEEMDADVVRVEQASSLAVDAAEEAQRRSTAAGTAKEAAEAARDTAIAARDRAVQAAGSAETAQTNAEEAQRLAEIAQGKSEDAQALAETAQGKAEEAQFKAETAQGKAEEARDLSEDFSEESKKWSIGKDRNGNDVASTDPTYQNSSLYWAGQSALHASESEIAKNAILAAPVSTVAYDESDESITVYLGGGAVNNNT